MLERRLCFAEDDMLVSTMKGVEADCEEIGELLCERLKLVPSIGVVVPEAL
jgi:hypothetical protein